MGNTFGPSQATQRAVAGVLQVGRTDPLRQPAGHLRPQPRRRLVAAPGDRDRAHQARPPTAERPPRAHAPDLKQEATRPAGANLLQQHVIAAASKSSATRSTTTATSSPAAAGSASAVARSTSASRSPSSWWESARSTTRSGWSASCSTIWDTSIEIRTGSSPALIPSPRTQYYPVCPEWTKQSWWAR